MKHVTIKDIARRLALSVSTVSRALADDKNIRKETKEKVLDAAKTLGYRPNPVATNYRPILRKSAARTREPADDGALYGGWYYYLPLPPFGQRERVRALAG